MKREKGLPLETVIRLFVKAARRIDKEGGYIRMQMEIGAKPEAPKPPAGKNDAQ